MFRLINVILDLVAGPEVQLQPVSIRHGSYLAPEKHREPAQQQCHAGCVSDYR